MLIDRSVVQSIGSVTLPRGCHRCQFGQESPVSEFISRRVAWNMHGRVRLEVKTGHEQRAQRQERESRSTSTRDGQAEANERTNERNRTQAGPSTRSHTAIRLFSFLYLSVSCPVVHWLCLVGLRCCRRRASLSSCCCCGSCYWLRILLSGAVDVRALCLSLSLRLFDLVLLALFYLSHQTPLLLPLTICKICPQRGHTHTHHIEKFNYTHQFVDTHNRRLSVPLTHQCLYPSIDRAPPVKSHSHHAKRSNCSHGCCCCSRGSHSRFHSRSATTSACRPRARTRTGTGRWTCRWPRRRGRAAGSGWRGRWSMTKRQRRGRRRRGPAVAVVAVAGGAARPGSAGGRGGFGRRWGGGRGPRASTPVGVWGKWGVGRWC